LLQKARPAQAFGLGRWHHFDAAVFPHRQALFPKITQSAARDFLISAILGRNTGTKQVREQGTLMDYTAIFILACIFIPLERLIPLDPEQGTFRRNWLNDLCFLLVNGFVVRAGFTIVAAVLMVAFNNAFGANPTPWIADLPVWVQVIAVIVVADIGYYTAHRTSHAVPFLWKFHAVHHSIEEMDWLATHRVHPVDQIFTNTLALLPIYFLGFSLEAVLIFQGIYQAQALLSHSNIKINFGPLKWLVASPEYHHWHHANEPDAYDRNFAAQLSIIDVIAGTMFLPKRRPATYGINEPMPQLYHQQLLHPFRGLAKALRRKTPRPSEALKGTTHEQDA
jgi:sterol desaturase/sphingolipid hydroxylase (fatty acid hydroxylase superfamily)